MKEQKEVPFSLLGDIEVENTNLEAHRSKQSLVQYGYRQDIFLSKFGKPVTSTRSGAVNQGYLARAVAIENSFEKALMRMTLKKQKFQVLSCGAGFDTTYFRMINAGILAQDTCCYFEVDYPNVALEKARSVVKNRVIMNLCLGKSNSRSFLTDRHGNFQVNGYTVIGCDLTKTQDLENLLKKFGFKLNVPTLVLCECSLTYIAVDKVSLLYRWLSSTVTKTHLIVYEQIQPNDRFGKIMKNHFIQRSTPLLNVDFYPTLRDQEIRLKCLGFSKINSVSLSEIITNCYGESERNRRKELEEHFDEFEELYLKCAHYSVLEGVTEAFDNTDTIWQSCHKDETSISNLYPTFYSTRPCHPIFRRYGHVMAITKDNKVVIMGGNSSLTGRDNILAIFKKTNLSRVEYLGKLESNCNTFSGFCSDSKTGIIYIFGGRNSPGEASSALLQIHLGKAHLKQEEVQRQSGSFWPESRWKHSLDLIGSKLTLIGGRNLSSVFRDVIQFDLNSKLWSKTGELPIELFSHSTCVWNSSIVILSGGLDGNDRISDKIFKVDENKIEIVNVNVNVSKILPRFGHSSYTYGSKLLLLGGVSLSQEPGLAVIDLLKPEYSREYLMDLPRSIGNYNHAGILQDDSIIITGGGGNCFSFGMHIGTESLEIQLKQLLL